MNYMYVKSKQIQIAQNRQKKRWSTYQKPL